MADNGGTPQREQWARTSDAHRTDFEKAKNPTPLRVGAWALWILSAAVEVAGILAAMGKLPVPLLSEVPALAVVVASAACLVLTLVAQSLWKKAGAVVQAKNQSALGVVMASAGFALWAVFFLLAKNLPASTKAAGIVAAALVVGSGVAAGVLV